MDLNAWTGALVGAIVVVAVLALLVGVVLGVALSSYGRFPVAAGVAVAVLVPILGPLVLAVVASVREVRRARVEHQPWHALFGWSVRGVDRRLRVLVLVAPVVAAVGLLVLLAVPVVRLRPVDSFPITVTLGTLPWGLSAAMLSVVAVLVATVISFRRPTRLGAVVAVSTGAVWAGAGAIVLVLSGPVLALLAQASAMNIPVMGRLALQYLPAVAPQLGGVLNAADMAIHARLGAAPLVAVVSGALLEAWAVAEVLIARRSAAAPPAVLSPSIARTDVEAPSLAQPTYDW